MPQVTTAGRLLGELQREGQAIRDAVVSAAGVSPERADESMIGSLRLTLSEQLRLAEAALVVAPRHARHALRLRAQALAARGYESGEFVERHRDAPVDRWEWTAQLRR
jgi:hypothetical protein